MEADAHLYRAARSREVRIWELACSHDLWSAACPGECLLQLSGQTEQGGLIAVARDTLYPDRKTLTGLCQREAHSRLPGGVEEGVKGTTAKTLSNQPWGSRVESFWLRYPNGGGNVATVGVISTS